MIEEKSASLYVIYHILYWTITNIYTRFSSSKKYFSPSHTQEHKLKSKLNRKKYLIENEIVARYLFAI